LVTLFFLASPPSGFYQRPSSLGSGVCAGGDLTLSTVFIFWHPCIFHIISWSIF